MVGVRQTGNTLAALRKRIEGIGDGRLRQKVLGKVGAELAAVQRQAFAAQASPAGAPWKPLRKARPGKILHRSGELERRATRPIFRGQVVEFSLPIYGPRQNFGYAPGGTPARPFMATDPLPFATRQRIERAVTDTVAAYLR